MVLGACSRSPGTEVPGYVRKPLRGRASEWREHSCCDRDVACAPPELQPSRDRKSPNARSLPGTEMEIENTQAEEFYSGALRRITRLMPIIAVLGTVVLTARFGMMLGAGFALGCAVAYLNFHWLKRAVIALADRVTNSGKPQSSKGIVLRFLLRYGLIALACYGIFRVSAASLYGLFAGFFLPVAAIACEAGYEVYVALRRGF